MGNSGSAAHTAIGNHASTTAGHARVAMFGTRLTPAGSVQNAKPPGSKPNVYAARNGRDMMIGTCGKRGKENRDDEEFMQKGRSTKPYVPAVGDHHLPVSVH